MKRVSLWIAVLPASIAAYCVTYTFFKLISYLFGYFGDPGDFHWATKVLLPALSSGLAVAAFLRVGLIFAPGHKHYTLKVLMVIAGAALAFSILLLMHNFSWIFFWENAGTTLGLVAGYLEINRELKIRGKIELIP